MSLERVFSEADRQAVADLVVPLLDPGEFSPDVAGIDGDTEAVVINLMGDIQPDQFGEVMVAMDVDSPGVEPAGSPHAPGG